MRRNRRQRGNGKRAGYLCGLDIRGTRSVVESVCWHRVEWPGQLAWCWRSLVDGLALGGGR
ncbi:hypothetical protein TIFTF001_035939 [Ficus carica]|uniref:Uncharacterized protein n=1 Tax=Ficus carica TaxID=3494 RepID=A0AA88E3B8_FICCA|nr:hypothetical protein TIFTF001_035939 [Ficus carica]